MEPLLFFVDIYQFPVVFLWKNYIDNSNSFFKIKYYNNKNQMFSSPDHCPYIVIMTSDIWLNHNHSNAGCQKLLKMWNLTSFEMNSSCTMHKWRNN